MKLQRPARSTEEVVNIDINQPETPRKPLPKWIKTDQGKQVFVDQGQHDPRLQGYRTPEGLRLEIVADFPTVANPVGMTFGDDGTLYVIEWLPGEIKEQQETFTYRDGSRRTVVTWKKTVKDVVKVLRATKGTGVYDEAQVILEEEFPSSILVHDGYLYLTGCGTVRRYRLSDLDGKRQAKPEIIALGFAAFHHRQVSGLAMGNDGWLYITAGADDHYAEGSDGSRATVLGTGAVFRCRPDGSRLHVFSRGYCNPYRDIAFDEAFNAFHADNDGADQGKFLGCRLMHVAEESDFGWRLAPRAGTVQADPLRAAVFGELPGKLPPLAKTGRGAPSGLFIYNDSFFPASFQGLLYYPDSLRQSVRAYKLRPQGSTFEIAAEFDFLQSDDPLFRPVQMIGGPDGAMYLCDWRGDPAKPATERKAGRIYRVRWAGTAEEPAIALRGLDSWAKIGKLPPQELGKVLVGPNYTDRLQAQRHLVRLGASVRRALLDVVEEPKHPYTARIAALGALSQLWNHEVRDACLALLFAGEPDLRRLAADSLALNGTAGDNEVEATLIQALGDQELSARRAIILALGRIGGAATPDALVNTFKAYKENDPFLYDAILRAIERQGKAGIGKLVAMAQSGVEKDFNRVVEAFRALRTRPAAEAIPELLSYPHLTIPQRVNLLRSYSNYQLDPPVALAPVVKYLQQNKDEPAQVKLAALEVLTMGGPLKNDHDLVEDIALSLLDQKDAAFRQALIGVIEKGRLAKAAPRLAQWLAEADRPDEERRAVLKALRILNDRSVVPMVRDFLDRAKVAGLRVEALRTLSVLEEK